jgi:thymidine phosphorylase
MVGLGQDAHGVRTVALLTDMATPLGPHGRQRPRGDRVVEVLAGGGPPTWSSSPLALAREMLGASVRAGEPLMTLFADEPARLDWARQALESAVEVAPSGSRPPDRPLVVDRVTA